MKHAKLTRLTVALSLAATAALAACADSARSPLAPDAPAAALRPTTTSAIKLTEKVKVTGAEWKTEIKADTTVGALIGPLGGVFRHPATGLTVVVPPFAVSKPTQFGVTALAGKVVAYDFQPAGSTFPIPLQMVQDVRYVKLDKLTDLLSFPQVAYFPSTSDIDQATGTANVLEFRPTALLNTGVTFTVDHFSGYIVAWGRR